MTAPYEALNRLCLNNWHYIDRKILKFHKEMNFFTGHSGSGNPQSSTPFRSFCTPIPTAADSSTKRPLTNRTVP